ncbi:glutamate decarboxylase [Methylacidimicrobium tartarophylax]|uniref:Glutamate decarboxylase n=1 Tax=Methylacidimicrobium tartarophylax TaxID=1041768 RepID=A0A5E6MEJ0_9BACT|nr:glutamate decarboxylase [Methylacidimicrobium tartarophylax]VVM06776.1 glutamate decarboxylase [Methylacidimicrobium tartarophylax]
MHKVIFHPHDAPESFLSPAYARRAMSKPAPSHRLPDGEMTPEVAYQLIHDELLLDGQERLNLATFVTTWMEKEARDLLAESFPKNLIDKDEYPQTAEIEQRCVSILAHLFHAPAAENPMGTSTIGSSEAAMLAGLALKWRWRKRRMAAGLPADRPNLVMGTNVQVVWEKFCRYFEVEPRLIPMTPGCYVTTPTGVSTYVDENSIGVIGILGTTMTGEYEPIEAIHDELVRWGQAKGWEVPLHVDAASGGFIAPFLEPHLRWDFRLPLVQSINVSGHKYGFVYPGVGWVLWRSQEAVPEELIFRVNYLGSEMPTFGLNFSRSGAPVVGQYYNFLRLGRAGYTRILQSMRETALFLSDRIAKMGPFDLVSDGSQIPAFAFQFKNQPSEAAFDLSEKLRERGWQVPAYTMPPNAEAVAVLRIVVREGFSRDMANLFLADLERALGSREGTSTVRPGRRATRFFH